MRLELKSQRQALFDLMLSDVGEVSRRCKRSWGPRDFT